MCGSALLSPAWLFTFTFHVPLQEYSWQYTCTVKNIPALFRDHILIIYSGKSWNQGGIAESDPPLNFNDILYFPVSKGCSGKNTIWAKFLSSVDLCIPYPTPQSFLYTSMIHIPPHHHPLSSLWLHTISIIISHFHFCVFPAKCTLEINFPTCQICGHFLWSFSVMSSPFDDSHLITFSFSFSLQPVILWISCLQCMWVRGGRYSLYSLWYTPGWDNIMALWKPDGYFSLNCLYTYNDLDLQWLNHSLIDSVQFLVPSLAMVALLSHEGTRSLKGPEGLWLIMILVRAKCVWPAEQA